MASFGKTCCSWCRCFRGTKVVAVQDDETGDEAGQKAVQATLGTPTASSSSEKTAAPQTTQSGLKTQQVLQEDLADTDPILPQTPKTPNKPSPSSKPNPPLNIPTLSIPPPPDGVPSSSSTTDAETNSNTSPMRRQRRSSTGHTDFSKIYPKGENNDDPNLAEWAKSEEALKDFLQQGGADISKLGTGTAKTLAALLHELEEGESMLQVDPETGKVSRHVELIFVHLRYGSKVLVLTDQVLEDGRKRTSLQRVILAKQGPGDGGMYNAAVRGMENAICIPADQLLQSGVLQYCEDLYAFEVESFESPSYPGLLSMYKTHYVQFNILEGGLKLFSNHGLPDCSVFETEEVTRRGTKTNKWTWLEVLDARRIKVRKFSPMLQISHAQAGDFSTLKTEQGLKLLLEGAGVNTSLLGIGKAKSLAALLAELQQGSSKLEWDSSGRLQRSVEPAFIQLWYNGRVLVEKMQVLDDGRERKRNTVLSEKKDPHDTHVLYSAFRCIEEKFGIEGAAAKLHESGMIRFDEERYCVMLETMDSASYPGIPCVYRTHYVKIDLLSGCAKIFEENGLGIPEMSDFTTTKKTRTDNCVLHWSWMTSDQAQEAKVKGILRQNALPANDGIESVSWVMVQDVDSTKEVEQLLKNGGVAIDQWGPTKSRRIRNLMEELWRGFCTLERSEASNRVRRVLNVAFITVKEEDSSLVPSDQLESLPTEGEPDAEDLTVIDIEEQDEVNICTSLRDHFFAEEGSSIMKSVVYRNELECFEAKFDDHTSFPGLPCVQRTKRLHVDTSSELQPTAQPSRNQSKESSSNEAAHLEAPRRSDVRKASRSFSFIGEVEATRRSLLNVTGSGPRGSLLRLGGD